ncbi:MAG: hypothetical protein GX121_06405 [Ignavibacteria bacterium]|jgi:hypothetical protein|nr:hypothetical protein [Ignavibacteria bacterium]
MAKQLTFSDKLKKKKQSDQGINVKVIKGMTSEKGSLFYLERFVRVPEASEIEKIDIS